MVTILEFYSPEHDRGGFDSASAPVKHPNGRSAEIIIFPGVRIERQKEQEEVSTAAKIRKKSNRSVTPKR